MGLLSGVNIEKAIKQWVPDDPFRSTTVLIEAETLKGLFYARIRPLCSCSDGAIGGALTSAADGNAVGHPMLGHSPDARLEPRHYALQLVSHRL